MALSEMTDLVSAPFVHTLFWQGTPWAELKTHNTKKRGGGRGEETGERWAVWWRHSEGKPASWHLNKCQKRGVGWMETKRDRIGAVRSISICCEGAHASPSGSGAPAWIVGTLIAAHLSGRCLSPPSPRIWSRIKEKRRTSKNIYAFSHPLPSRFLNCLSESELRRCWSLSELSRGERRSAR